MKNNYILIDYENVQPKELAILNGHTAKVMVFVGTNQAKVPIDFATSLQNLGGNGQYIQISGNGRNALDFHLAFYIGVLSERDPDAFFHIISRDSGFDPLIEHLKASNRLAARSTSLTDVPFLKLSNLTSSEDRLTEVIKNLTARGQSRPRKIKTLTNTINSMFMKKLSGPELASLIEQLQSRDLILVENEAVSYRPPITQS